MYNIYLLLISWRTIKLALEQNVGGGYLMENYPHNFLKGKGDFDYQFLNSFFHTLNRWTGNQYNHWKFEKFEGKSWYWETFAFILVVLKLLNSYEFTWHMLLSTCNTVFRVLFSLLHPSSLANGLSPSWIHPNNLVVFD